MSQSVSIKLFEERNVRTLWDEEAEKWYFSVHDVIAILTNQPDYEKVRNYWKWLRNKLKQEGSQLGSDTTQLKLQAADGKFYMTDVAGDARRKIEAKIGKSIISKQNSKELKHRNLLS